MIKPKELVHRGQLKIKPYKTIEKRKISQCGFLSVHPDLRKREMTLCTLEHLKLKSFKIKIISVFFVGTKVFLENLTTAPSTKATVPNTSAMTPSTTATTPSTTATTEHSQSNNRTLTRQRQNTHKATTEHSQSNGSKHNSSGQNNSGDKSNSSGQDNSGDKSNSSGQDNSGGA
jgi:hypothetical protein